MSSLSHSLEHIYPPACIFVNWKTKNNFVSFSIDCDDIFRQQPSLVSHGIFRIKPRLSSESFDVQCVFENNTGK